MPRSSRNDFKAGRKEKNFNLDDDSGDTIEFSSQGGLGYREIVMMQFHKCTTNCNVEFRGGFYTIDVKRDGSEVQKYVPDSREVFSNSVYGLAILLQPKFDKKMSHKFLQCRKLLKDIQKDFMEKSIVDEEVILGSGFYEHEKDKILLEQYKNKKLEISLTLFTHLSKQLSRKGYLEMGGGTFE